MTDYKEKLAFVLKFLTNRLFILGVVSLVGFAVLVGVLFERQIVHGTYFVPNIVTHPRTIPINAPRGNIYDVNGRPLAISKPVFVVTMDPSIIFQVLSETEFDLNEAFLLLMDIMARSGHTIAVDSEFLITHTTPRLFTVQSETVQRRWKNDFGINPYLDAPETFAKLLEMFDIPLNLNQSDQYTLLRLRAAHWHHRFDAAQVTISVDIDRATVAALEEFGHALPGIGVAFDYLRYYPEGRYLTNIIGYIARINEADLAANEHLGYTGTDLFGVLGLERSMEYELRGIRGQEIFEVDNNFRRVGVAERIEPIPGQNVFLTIDAQLQRDVYHILEDTLSTIHLNHLRQSPQAFSREIMASTVQAGNINALHVMDADGDYFPASYALQSFVLSRMDDDTQPGTTQAFARQVNEIISTNILSGHINMTLIFEVMAEQELIEFAPYELARLRAGQLSHANFITSLIESRQLTPQMMNIDPATASAAISCIHTGALIAAVNYPTFDGNNWLPHISNTAYINRANNDPTAPQIPRAFAEVLPPGSTFKMVTALAALSQGIITPETRIFDNVVFRDAGAPYVRCMGSHGHINVAEAIAASCNYFFNRVAFNMGNHRDGRTQYGIGIMNYYMYALGLGSPTGVQVPERGIALASPQFMQDRGIGGNWTDGMTSHVSIGQGLVEHSVVSMAKVMATLATGGTRMQMTLIDRLEAADGTVTPFVPTIEYQLDIDPAHLEVIHRGMRDVTTSGRGTGRGIFAGFPMTVAVKSGTSEVSGVRASHTSYGGFAPFEDPQIAIYVVVPHSQSRFLSSPAGNATRDILSHYFNLQPDNIQVNGSTIR